MLTATLKVGNLVCKFQLRSRSLAGGGGEVGSSESSLETEDTEMPRVLISQLLSFLSLAKGKAPFLDRDKEGRMTSPIVGE